MRRILCFILSLALVLSAIGCSTELPSMKDILEAQNQDNTDSNLPARLESLNQAFERDKTNKSALTELISFHKERGDYRSCVSVYEDYLASAYNDLDTLIDLAYCQMELGDYSSAQATCEKAIQLNGYSAEAYNTLGNVYGDLTEYGKAIEAYRKASSLDVSFAPSRTNTLWALFYSSRYEECIREADALAGQGFENYDLYYYTGGSYEALNKPQEAIKAYNRALEFDTGNYSDTYYHLGLISFTDKDYDNARKYIASALLQNPKNEDARWLADELEKLDVPLNQRLYDFIQAQYLYKDQYQEFQENINQLKLAPAASANIIVDTAKKALHPEDPFSFFITGSDYDAYITGQEAPTVFHSVRTLGEKSIELFRIEYFTAMTGKDFVRLADKIENKEQKVLVFDLRGNGGGDMKASSEILDYLLEECATVNFINREGYTSSYYSSKDRVLFKRIIILTDNATASAAELLTLGLKVYQPDTIVIGDKTFGKGVSQLVFDDPRNKLSLWLVSSYWNVREINIHGYGIQPDVTAKTQQEIDSALQNALNMIQ